MGDQSMRPELLAVPTPDEAGLLVEALDERGIRAGFNAEPSILAQGEREEGPPPKQE
jgi:hypothetical protein